MAVPKLNLEIYQGATFTKSLAYKNPPVNVGDQYGTAKDLSQYTARMQIRASVSDTTVICDLNTTNGKITIDGPLGVIRLIIDATTTAAMSFQNAVYDLEIVAPDGVVTRLVEGKVKLHPEVTR